MKWIIFLVLVCSVNICLSQYYYNDLVTAKQTNDQYVLLKNNHISSVNALSFEADGTPSEGFTLSQQLNSAGTELTTITDFPSAGRSVSVGTYSNNRIVKTVDTSDRIKKITTYAYSNEQLQTITTQTIDEFMSSNSTEVHQYFYEGSRPVKMLLIKNNTDTTTIEFIPDEQQNVAEEHWIKQNKIAEKYFYYYNQQHQLTDIVRFNLKANRMLPDFLFEYAENGAIQQMTQIPEGSDDYLIWVYDYNNNGLKQTERCFNKQKQLVGRIVYKYNN